MATIGIHYVKSSLKGAEKQGIDTRAILRRARIPEKLLHSSNTRVHTDQVSRLFRLIWQALNDEFMGFTETPSKPGTFALMADWVSAGETLEDLLKRGIRFYNQISDDIQMTLHYSGDEVYLSTEFRRPELDPEHFYLEFWHVIWHRFASWYIGKPIKLLAANLNYTPVDPNEYTYLFRCPTHTRRPRNELVFHRSYLDEPMIRSPRDLQVFLRRSPMDLLTIPGEDTSLTAQITLMLQAPKNSELSLPNSPELAASLNISEQTLRRRLHAEGISYQQIKDNLRSDMAIKMLANRNIRINDIARQLGFSEPRAFTRAFKHWSGLTPRDYRSQRQKN